MGVLFSCCLGFFLLVFGIIFYKIWLLPMYVQSMMRSQGIKGPSYKFLFGNNKEIFNMRKKSMSTPMDLSDHVIFPRVLPHTHEWITLYGKNFVMWDGLRPQLIVTEPELIKEIVNDKEGDFPKMKRDIFLRNLVGDGLVMADGEKWIKHRRIANHAFNGESLKNMLPEMVESVESMIKKWRNHEGREIEVYSEFRDLSSEIISRTAFGSSYLEGKNIFQMLTQLGYLISKNIYKPSFFITRKYFKTADDKQSNEIEKSLRESIMSIIKKREDQVMAGRTDSYGSDFLGSLLKVHNDQDIKNRISVDDIVDECKTFYLAGHETLSSALSWTVFLLSIYTDWQDKAREEILQLFGHEKPKPECNARLKITTMIINETLRLYSPIALLARRVRNNKVKLGRLTLPGEMDVLIPIYALHGNQEVWGTDAHLFKPERFSEGVTKATNYNTTAYLPFGGGPRICVGLNFATNELKIALSMILQHYKFTLSPNYIHTPFLVLTTQPEQGIQIIISPLKHY
ncbi:hypothetical protein M9H77_09790 [Catharanthus roseus]|uniref:Uncharacterized protein n=1 Tax=Catharanthus roseus TaxID=4058 RepID=A0ACC0C1S3_CATRO|nr:hypothetical protein M9H77_09790 [Catharanthus roseus]